MVVIISELNVISSKKSLPAKLFIKEDYRVILVHAPEGYQSQFEQSLFETCCFPGNLHRWFDVRRYRADVLLPNHLLHIFILNLLQQI